MYNKLLNIYVLNIFVQIDDAEFNIPKVNDIPTVESILNNEDVSLISEDDLNVYSNKVNTIAYLYQLTEMCFINYIICIRKLN